MRLVIVGSIIFLALGVLVTLAIIEGRIPVYRVNEFAEALAAERAVFTADPATGKESGEECRIDGEILSIQSHTSPLRFTICPPKSPGVTLKVESSKNPPDNFKDKTPISVRGRYDREKGAFIATDMTTQCPTKYEAEFKKEPPPFAPARGVQ